MKHPLPDHPQTVKRLLTLPLLFAFALILPLVPARGQTGANCITIHTPGNLVTNAGPNCARAVAFEVTATSTCASRTTVSCQPPSGTLFPLGTNLVTCQATDTAGNRKSTTFAIIVRDQSPPRLTVPRIVNATCTGPDGADVDFDVTATDECDRAVTIRCVPPSGSRFPRGTSTVHCVAIDSAGNQSEASFTVNVTGDCDNCLTLACPTELVILRSGRTGLAQFDLEIPATNHCGGPVEVLCDPPRGSWLAVGTHTIACTASDGAGTVVKCEFRVVVEDRTPPTLLVPAAIVRSCQGVNLQNQPGAQVWFPEIKVTDNADPAPHVVCTPPGGSTFPVGTNTVQCTATDKAGNHVTKSFQVVVTAGEFCGAVVADPELTLAPDNWGFELGNLTGWVASGNAFTDQPLLGERVTVKRDATLTQQMNGTIGGDYWRDVTYAIGFKGHYWIGTGDSAAPLFSDQPGGAADPTRTGTLLSKSFTIDRPYITFLVGGDKDLPNLRVELLIRTNHAGVGTIKIGAYDYRIAQAVTGHGDESMRRDNFTTQNLLGTEARIRIVDNSTTGHLNVDDFRFQDAPPLFTTVTVGGRIIPSAYLQNGRIYDWDAPLWGFADLHTHPMSHLGFGGKVMHGYPDGPAAEALSDCNPNHGGPGPDNSFGDYYRQLMMTVMDDAGPEPHRYGYTADSPWKQFRNWPVFWTISHQQMWHEWVKRAYDGGLRVMVALCVNAELLAQVSRGHLAHDDLAISTNQIQALKQFVAAHSDFMEIAYDPFQMRQIIRGNRMAVIIGTELDDIGNLCHDPFVTPLADAYSRKRALAEIDRLYQLGVRYMFPVHLVNNKFGGTATESDMLNVANKFINGSAFDLEDAPQDEGLHVTFEHLDFTPYVAAFAPALSLVGPAMLGAAPGIEALLDSHVGPLPPGSGALISGAMAVPAAIAAANLPLLNAIGLDPIPFEVWPMFDHFPDYGKPSWGHRNHRGLTPLGEFAVREMMKRGIMLDVDHMGHHTFTNVIAQAEAVPGGYPLNSGHNSFRPLHVRAGENSRTLEQLIHIRDLGGLMGIGWENSEAGIYPQVGQEPLEIISTVEDDCAGTSKSVAQHYLYAVDHLGHRQVALGSDMDGFISGPGPRFGPQSAFGLEFQPEKRRVNEIAQQENGVLYEPKHGRPLTTPVFVGKAMDPDRDTDKARTELGYRYNKDQASFFAAIRIFLWKPSITSSELDQIVDAMHDAYPDKGRINELTRGLIKGYIGDSSGSDAEKVAAAVYRKQTLNLEPSNEIVKDLNKYVRYGHLSLVWHDYHRSFGQNAPMKRCVTLDKSWDYNFEGVAHYGLLPDFLQDLSNVALQTYDLSPLFQSAEDFAQMWTKCLQGADAIIHPPIRWAGYPSAGNGTISLEWFGEESDQIEESDDLTPGDGWRLVQANTKFDRGHWAATVPLAPGNHRHFYRIRK